MPVAGVEDDGYPRGLSKHDLDSSLVTLRAMAEAVSADIQPLREMPASKGRAYLIVRVHRLCLDELSYTDLHIAGAQLLATAVTSFAGCEATGIWTCRDAVSA